KPAKSIILSNTCDIDPANKRNFPSRIVYAPIIELDKYRKTILSNSKKNPQQIESHIDASKKQEITQVFYVPSLGDKLKDSIVFLDRVCNLPNEAVEREKVTERRVFTLSDYGSYLFLLKLSIHFTRIQDQVERKSLV
ncbi:hypothetical protein, partial [Salinimicrobium oceani]